MVSEETSIGEKSAAYVLNKGDQLRMCVRKRNDPTKLEDSNTMIFVLLHELAHLMCKIWSWKRISRTFCFYN